MGIVRPLCIFGCVDGRARLEEGVAASFTKFGELCPSPETRF